MQICEILKANGIFITIIPAYTDVNFSYRPIEYADAYVRAFNINPEDKPELCIVVRVNSESKCLDGLPIYIFHSKITGRYQRLIKSLLIDKYPWFTWEILPNTAMCIDLNYG